jgi:hypothetical protein
MIEYSGSDLVVRNVAGRKVAARLYNAQGRSLNLLRDNAAAGNSVRISIDRRLHLGPGVYVLQLQIDGKVIRAKCVASDSRVLWQGGLAGVAAAPGNAEALAKTMTKEYGIKPAGGQGKLKGKVHFDLDLDESRQ